jgi:hypothetical protein
MSSGSIARPRRIACGTVKQWLASTARRTFGPIASRTALIRARSSFGSPSPIFILMARKPWPAYSSASSTASSISRSMSVK